MSNNTPNRKYEKERFKRRYSGLSPKEIKGTFSPLLMIEDELNHSDRNLDKAKIVIDHNKSYFNFAKGAQQPEIKNQY